MERKMLRGFAVLAMLALGGLVAMQVYWFRQAFDMEEADFRQRVSLALFQVNERIHNYNRTQSSLAEPVKQVSGAYYKVMVNDVIEPTVLEEALRLELGKQQIEQDFEFGIYDCLAEKVQFRQFVCVQDDCEIPKNRSFSFPSFPEENYYFGVYFPGKNASLLQGMEIWIFSSITLLIVVFFFLYSLFFIFRQKKLSELQRDFVNNLTHEFKTPLAAISMSVETLSAQQAENPERKERYLSIIRKESQRLQEQVERILQLSTPQKSELLKPEPVALKSLTEELLPSWGVMAESYLGKVELSEIPEEATINADPFHLANVLQNLIENALKYNQPHPEVVVSFQPDGRFLKIAIADNGKPFSEVFKKQMFRQFVRGENLPEEIRKNGFGLGLYYVKEVVTAMGGRVWAENLGSTGKQIVLQLKKY